MEYRRIGDSELVVSTIGLGSWLTYSGGLSPTGRPRAPVPRTRPA